MEEIRKELLPDVNEQFTEKELYWIKKLEEAEETIKDPTKKSKENWLINSYLDWLDMLIKYGNLRNNPEEYEVTKRVVRINRVIPEAFLKAGHHDYKIFNGLYVVCNVLWVRAENCSELLRGHYNDNPNIDSEKFMLSSFKQITFENGERWCIFIEKSDFVMNWLGYRSSSWSYQYLYDDEIFF